MSFDDQRLVIINFYIIYWLFLLCFCVLSIVKRTGTLSDSFNLLIVNIYTWLHCDTFLKYTTTTKIIIVRQVSNIHVKRCTNNKMKIKREKSCVVNKKKHVDKGAFFLPIYLENVFLINLCDFALLSNDFKKSYSRAFVLKIWQFKELTAFHWIDRHFVQKSALSLKKKETHEPYATSLIIFFFQYMKTVY